MDVERTIEFILESQAKAEVQLGALRDLVQQGMKLLVGYQTNTDRRITDTDRRIDALIDSQLRLEDSHLRLEDSHLRLEDSHRRMEESRALTDAKFQELAEVQKITEQKLQGLIDALRQGRNGG